MGFLVVRQRGRVVIGVPLKSRLKVGRQGDNDLVLADRHVSRHHASFEVTPAGVVVADLGSRHGTLVNEERITERMLGDGDRVQIGGALLTYQDADAEDDGEVVQTIHYTPVPSATDRDARRLAAIYDVGRALATASDPRHLASEALGAVLATLECERGLVVLGADAAVPGARVERSRSGALVADEIIVSRGIVERLLVRRESLLIGGSGYTAPTTLVRQGVRAAMAAPLVAGDQVLGFVYLDDRMRADRFGHDELDFLTVLARLVAAALVQVDRAERTSAVAQALRDAHPVPVILGQSPAMQALNTALSKYAHAADVPVLVRGESGTGKELAAATLHALSPRADEPFVTVNCAAIPDTLLESELFGHERGAFTGAAKARRGKFALAHRGTLFLDEVADLSPAAQAKILRAIEKGEVQPLGSEETLEVDVRIISATHKPLDQEIAAGRFREDLYYRLAVGEVVMPPLRERGEDVLVLAHAFLVDAARAAGRRVIGFSERAQATLRRRTWRGNVRELRNVVERAVILADGPTIELEPEAVATTTRASDSLADSFARLDTTERDLVARALADAGGNVAEAARLLGISRIMLKRRLDRFGLG